MAGYSPKSVRDRADDVIAFEAITPTSAWQENLAVFRAIMQNKPEDVLEALPHDTPSDCIIALDDDSDVRPSFHYAMLK